jgi:hypothetical protein
VWVVPLMPGSEGVGLLHLAERRDVAISGRWVERTPLLVPAFSSRVPDVEKIFRASEEFVSGPILISAYDLARGLIKPPYDFAPFVFLDSGGYEVSGELDLSDVGGDTPRAHSWSPEEHSATVSAWDGRVPCVSVSYDHPDLRQPFPEQIGSASALPLPSGMGRELLLKPEKRSQSFIDVDSFIPHVRQLDVFDVIGVTEREIGNSILERMVNIARLRLALRKAGLETPIHVFGSMDSATTLFYFIAGADIFDGLTWLRYAFREGSTLYKQNFGILEVGIAAKSPVIEALCWWRNYQYMTEMQLQMRRFLSNRDFGVFRHYGSYLAEAYESVKEHLEV